MVLPVEQIVDRHCRSHRYCLRARRKDGPGDARRFISSSIIGGSSVAMRLATRHRGDGCFFPRWRDRNGDDRQQCARREGACRACLRVAADNAAARALYRKPGYGTLPLSLPARTSELTGLATRGRRYALKPDVARGNLLILRGITRILR